VFIDHRKLPNSALRPSRTHGRRRGADALAPKLTELARGGASIALDSATAADALSRLIDAAGGKPVRGNDPVSLLKAVKNITEIEGTRDRASARCGGTGAIPRLDRPRSAIGRADGDRHRRGTGDIPARGPAR